MRSDPPFSASQVLSPPGQRVGDGCFQGYFRTPSRALHQPGDIGDGVLFEAGMELDDRAIGIGHAAEHFQHVAAAAAYARAHVVHRALPAPLDQQPIRSHHVAAVCKVDLRVATVVKAEAVPRAKKLLQLEIDLGEKRTIVAGIAASYPPEELVGKQIIVVANLKPAKIMGILSNGMLLAAVDKQRTTLATLDGKVKPGTALR